MKIKKSEEANCKREVMAWEGHCWQVINQDKKELTPDPFYSRNDVLTESIVTAIILAHEENLKYEISHYPIYHIQHQGIGSGATHSVEQAQAILQPTHWDELPYDQQFAIVQGIDQICQKYRDDGAEAAPEPVIIAVYLDDWNGC